MKFFGQSMNQLLAHKYMNEAGADGAESGGGADGGQQGGENGNEGNQGGADGSADNGNDGGKNGGGDGYQLSQERAVELKAKYTDEAGNLNVDALLSALDQSQAQSTAPESYSNDFFKTEESLQGYEIANDDPIITAAQQWAKENNVSQDKYQQLITVAMGEIIKTNKALEAQEQQQMKEAWDKIPDAEARRNKVGAQLAGMFSEDFKGDLDLMVNHPKIFPVLESLLGKVRDPKINTDRTPPIAALSRDDMQQLRVKRDEAAKSGNHALAEQIEKQIKKGYEALEAAGKLS